MEGNELKTILFDNFDELDGRVLTDLYRRALPGIMRRKYGVWIEPRRLDERKTPEQNYQAWTDTILPRFGSIERYKLRRSLPENFSFDEHLSELKDTGGFTWETDKVKILCLLAAVCGLSLNEESSHQTMLAIWNAGKKTKKGWEVHIDDFTFELIEHQNCDVKVNGLTPEMVERMRDLSALSRKSID